MSMLGIAAANDRGAIQVDRECAASHSVTGNTSRG